jgi:hypothetical protein
MRTLTLLMVVAACGTDGTDGTPPPDSATSTRGFTIRSPDITIEPGQEITYCYYFKTPNTEPMVIDKWSSTMTPGSHHMIMFTTSTDSMPPGTVSDEACGGFSAGNVPNWTYAAQTPENAVALPDDDGTGLPLGQEIAAGTSGYFQMHYLNASDEPLEAHVEVVAEALEPGVAYTKTAAYVTYNSQISVPPGATDHVESQTCTVPAGAKFWTMSTHAHKQATTTTVKDGMPDSTTIAFTSDDWEHPGAKTWMAMPFYSFASGKLTYECTYSNTGSNAGSTVVSGPSAETNEMCMATGYYFPATKPLICLNSLGPF